MTSATVYALNKDRQPIICRALLDTCSSANFMTDNLAASLQLPKKRCSVPVGGLNNLTTMTRDVVTLTIRSTQNSFEKTLSFLTLPRISDLVPSEAIPRESFCIPANIRLADPDFHKPAPVDLLLGAGPTLSLLSIGQINLSQQGQDLVLQKTRLGWIVGGSIESSTRQKQRSATCHLSDLHSEITKFWEIEEGPAQSHLSPEELACEEHFQRNITRDSSGRYVVALPFQRSHQALGESRARALKRLDALERKFHRNTELRDQYSAVINEYLELGHMSPARDTEKATGFYLPHHAVIKEASMTTKIRVVFDGSAKSSTGVSLNDVLMVGPTIQDDIFAHVIRFRLHNYVLTGDIEKMYRQFLVREEDRQFQRILWKHAGEIKTFELNTVTFGLGPAPFLAIRALQQLADDESNRCPRAATILKRDLYVDDLLTGAETIEEGIVIRDEIIQVLRLGGLNMRQWASNDPRLLEGISENNVNLKLQLSSDKTLKTLGVFWNSQEDSIVYTAKPLTVSGVITKRMMLSEIAKIYDPLGLLGPITLYAKGLMQKLWQLKLNWDESVPSNIHTTWTQFCEQLKLVNNLSFDRRILTENITSIQLHGFCDASETGYGACIYLRSTNNQGQSQCKLLCAKSRVAPLKTVSIPRLELCGAQLLANLYNSVVKTIEKEIDTTTFWTDSTIVLCWINDSPHTLKTFVANRVAKIQEKTNPANWRHISSEDNPADALSRGQLPEDFIQNNLWKFGPKWILSNETSWPTRKRYQLPEVPEKRQITCLATSATMDDEIFNRFSSFTKLKRVIAYCLRFKPRNRFTGALRTTELVNAEKVIIRKIQATAFSKEIRDLSGGRRVDKGSKLISLDPFVDKDNLLRVGGRLSNSGIPYSQQHPILLPRSNYVSDLIIQEQHLSNLHSGIQTTLYAMRRRYWLLDGRNQVRKIIRKCIRCFRFNPATVDYTMGNLPDFRITQARPFYNVGVDYCGPFYLKEKKYRNRSKIKVYVAVFVCLVIKAVHLEVVSDMTTDAFLGALRRFISRRGKPHSIHSDNGSNFKGANNELHEIYTILQSHEHQEKVTHFLCDQGITWKFIPPLSPHFGGIWESAVKSFKHHLKRVIGNVLFTFEEFNTLAIEIEAILNSRPLTPISTDPNDLLVLTPGHFLIGDSLTSLPELDFSSTPSNRLSNWQHIQKLRRDFWARWYKEYLNELNIRHKWTTGDHSIKEGTIVLLKEDNLPPMQWVLARVIATYPGADGIVRTVTVKTVNGEFDRNVRRLAPLPINQEDINTEL